MGAAFFKLFFKLGNKECRTLMLGLDAAGKTTILYKLKLGEVRTNVPTIGFNTEEVSYKNLTLQVWDIGGQDKIRKLWGHYYEGTHCLIFVVDSSDRSRLAEVREELHHVLSDDRMHNASVLVYANKQDLPGAANAAELAQKLDLAGMPGNKDRQWWIQATSALSGDGLHEGLDWIVDHLPVKK